MKRINIEYVNQSGETKEWEILPSRVFFGHIGNLNREDWILEAQGTDGKEKFYLLKNIIRFF